MQETVFDNMESWTVEMSRNGLTNCLIATMTNQVHGDADRYQDRALSDKYESALNQLLTFMVRDIERRG